MAYSIYDPDVTLTFVTMPAVNVRPYVPGNSVSLSRNPLLHSSAVIRTAALPNPAKIAAFQPVERDESSHSPLQTRLQYSLDGSSSLPSLLKFRASLRRCTASCQSASTYAILAESVEKIVDCQGFSNYSIVPAVSALLHRKRLSLPHLF